MNTTSNNSINGGRAGPSEYSCLDQPSYTPRKLRVVATGAGISGLTFAYKMQKDPIPGCEFVIYEKNHDIGGTWIENTYDSPTAYRWMILISSCL